MEIRWNKNHFAHIGNNQNEKPQAHDKWLRTQSVNERENARRGKKSIKINHFWATLAEASTSKFYYKSYRAISLEYLWMIIFCIAYVSFDPFEANLFTFCSRVAMKSMFHCQNCAIRCTAIMVNGLGCLFILFPPTQHM